MDRVRAAQRAVSAGAPLVAVQHQVAQSTVCRWMRRCGLDAGVAGAAGVHAHVLGAAASAAFVAVLWVDGLRGLAFAAVAAAAAAGGLRAVRHVAAGGEIVRLRGEISDLRGESRRVGAETVLLAEINRRLTPRVETLGRHCRLSEPAKMPATAYELLSEIDESRALPGRVETLRAVFDRVDAAYGLSYRERMDALVDILDMLDRIDSVDTV